MAKGMGVDVRETFPFTELLQSLGNGVRPNGSAVRLGMHIARMHPMIAICNLQLHLRDTISN